MRVSAIFGIAASELRESNKVKVESRMGELVVRIFAFLVLLCFIPVDLRKSVKR